jgi:DNA primase
MIPKENIEEVLARASIVGVISEYLPLTKRGANHVGLCPFHSEKTPSFSVNEAKRIFYCFGCNETGNVISFVMKMDGTTFPETVRSLGAKYGVSIAEEKSGATGFRKSLLAVNSAASDYFAEELRSRGGAPAREYLKGRGFKDQELLDSFKVGFAPDSWDGLLKYLKGRGVDTELAEKAGVVVKKKNGYYDRFRGRLIFPITDIKGRIIGFGGRGMGAEQIPKYLNSPESMLFKKGDVLFGMHQARAAIAERGFAIVVEGYFDLLAMHRAGFTNTVATMGTALTVEQIRSIKGYAGSIYALFDTDQAGKKAAIRGLKLFLAQEMPCKVVRIEGGKDPDEFLAAKGAEAMKSAIERAEPLMEFYLKDLSGRYNLRVPEEKERFLNEALEYVRMIKGAVEAGHYAVMLATMLGIPVEAVYGMLKVRPVSGARAAQSRSVKGLIKMSTSNLMERTVLKIIFIHPELYSPRVDMALAAFKDGGLRAVGESMALGLKEGRAVELSELVDGLEDEGLKRLIAKMFMGEDDGFIENPEKMLDDSLTKVLGRGRLKETTEYMLKTLEASGMKETAEKIRNRAKGRPLNK